MLEHTKQESSEFLLNNFFLVGFCHSEYFSPTYALNMCGTLHLVWHSQVFSDISSNRVKQKGILRLRIGIFEPLKIIP